jgi:hypothetical protein
MHLDGNTGRVKMGVSAAEAFHPACAKHPGLIFEIVDVGVGVCAFAASLNPIAYDDGECFPAVQTGN